MDLIERYLGEMERVLQAISRDDIRRAIGTLFDAWRWSKTVWIVADGGILASYLADDLHRATLVEGQPALHAARLVEQMSTLCAGDVIVALSWAGDSANVLHAAQRAKDIGAMTLALCGEPDTALAQVADFSVVVPGERATQQADGYAMVVHAIALAVRERIEMQGVRASNASAIAG